jgi:hypothetical protein
MPVPSPVLAALSTALRRLEAAAARAPSSTRKPEGELEPLVDQARQALDRLADELDRRSR